MYIFLKKYLNIVQAHISEAWKWSVQMSPEAQASLSPPVATFSVNVLHFVLHVSLAFTLSLNMKDFFIYLLDDPP